MFLYKMLSSVSSTQAPGKLLPFMLFSWTVLGMEYRKEYGAWRQLSL